MVACSLLSSFSSILLFISFEPYTCVAAPLAVVSFCVDFVSRHWVSFSFSFFSRRNCQPFTNKVTRPRFLEKLSSPSQQQEKNEPNENSRQGERVRQKQAIFLILLLSFFEVEAACFASFSLQSGCCHLFFLLVETRQKIGIEPWQPPTIFSSQDLHFHGGQPLPKMDDRRSFFAPLLAALITSYSTFSSHFLASSNSANGGADENALANRQPSDENRKYLPADYAAATLRGGQHNE